MHKATFVTFVYCHLYYIIYKEFLYMLEFLTWNKNCSIIGYDGALYIVLVESAGKHIIIIYCFTIITNHYDTSL